MPIGRWAFPGIEAIRFSHSTFSLRVTQLLGVTLNTYAVTGAGRRRKVEAWMMMPMMARIIKRMG